MMWVALGKNRNNNINTILLFLPPLTPYCYFKKWNSKINKVIFYDIKLLNTKCGRSQGHEDLFQDLQVQNQVMH